jgi:tRNA U34 2-thiouridine synthase MnmA/TrmU
MAKAVALFSKGLDSTLAILTILKQGIEVKAIKFLTNFNCDVSDRYLCPKDLFSVAERFGFEVKLCYLSDKFIDIVKNPKFGYGKNMNPCIDCKILMLKEAKAVMNMIGADFIITGEVLGQRPMSQRRDSFYLIDREAGVIDYVLRPLSARLLKITSPEAKGIINREMLYGFSGRSRKPQMAIAEELGLTDYPAPAGGCLLTEPNYAYRLKDLLTYNPAPRIRDFNLLKMGRHFRFSPLCKIIVGRNKDENETIGSLSGDSDYLLKVDGYGSPITLVIGEITDEALKVAASICARYSDAKNLSEVEAIIINRDNTFRLRVSPAGSEIVETLRIEKLKNEKIAKALQVRL